MKNFTTWSKNNLTAFFSITTAIIVWWIVSLFYPTYIIPSPLETLKTTVLLAMDGKLTEQLLITLQRFIIGFVVSLILGTLLGVIAGSIQRIDDFLRPLVTTVQTVPPISWIILAIMWFQTGSAGPTLLILVIATFPIFFFNALQGIRQVPEQLVEMAKTFRVNRMRIIQDVYVPSIWPFVSSAISICIGISWKTIVMAELLSSNSGVGAMMELALLNVETEEIMAWTLIVTVFGVATEHIFNWFNKRTRVGRIQQWKSGT